MEDRHDPMLSYAMTALAAGKQARLAGQRATFGRIDVAPNGTNAIPSRVTAWLDARCDSDESLAALVAEIERLGTERAGRDGTRLEVTAESVSGAVAFDPALTGRLRAGLADALGRGPGDPDDGRPRRRHPRRGRGADGDDVRPQPDRRLPLAGGARRDRPTASPASRRWPTPSRCWSREHASGCEHALLEDGVADDVLLEVEGGRINSVRVDGQSLTLTGDASPEHARFPRAPGETGTTPGLTLPGLANCHSPRVPPGAAGAHADRSAGRSGPGASRCTPSRRSSPRTPTSRWPARPTPRCAPPGSPRSGSSTTCTTSPTGRRTTTPTRWAGRCSPRPTRPGSGSGCSTPATSRPASAGAPEGVQVRYSDGDAHAWAERVAAFDDPRVGAAIHSVRAVPRDQLTVVVEAAAGMPLHVHLSEQVAENEACLAATGLTPTQLLAEAGALGPLTTRRARHPPHRRRHPAARREPHQRLLLPDDRARPRRRHRPGAAVARRGRDAHAGLGQPCGDRPVRGDARGGDARTAGAPSSAGTGRPLELLAAATYDGHRSLGFAGRRPDRRGAAGRPRHRRPRHDPHPRHRRHRRRRWSSPPPPPTSGRVPTTRPGASLEAHDPEGNR